MPDCPNCEAEVATDQSFCRECGTELTSISTKKKETASSLDPELVDKFSEHLGPDETPAFILKGATVKTEGNIDSVKSSLSGGGGVKTIITNERVFIHISKRLTGDDMRTIPYDSINAVNLDTGIINNFLSTQTGGGTYKMQVLNKDEAKNAVDYIRNQKEKLAQAESGSNEPDPTEQLKNIKELYDQGVLSEQEFEEKKRDLMDKI